jgi:hypothetical protein
VGCGARLRQAPVISVSISQDEDNLREALKYSAAMLGELRTSQLSPQKYYELYIQVTAEMGHIEVLPPRHDSQPNAATEPMEHRRVSSPTSGPETGPTQICTSWSNTPAMYYLDCKHTTARPCSTSRNSCAALLLRGAPPQSPTHSFASRGPWGT